jgi:hypothetical protein
VRGILQQLIRRNRRESAYDLVHLSQRKGKWHFPSFTLFTFISDIADNSSQHAHPCFKHYSSSGQMWLWANVFLGKCLSGQMSFWADVLLGKRLLGKCLSGQMSFWANVFLGKRLMGKCLSRQMSFWANNFWANVHLGKCLSGQMASGQLSSGQMSLGKCLWPNVVWANVGSLCRGCGILRPQSLEITIACSSNWLYFNSRQPGLTVRWNVGIVESWDLKVSRFRWLAVLTDCTVALADWAKCLLCNVWIVESWDFKVLRFR